MSSPQVIVIVGAGVLGLSTARVLQDRYPGTRITIVAAEIPLVPPVVEAPRPSADNASMWAGAHYRPTPGPDRQSADEHKLALQTAEVMKSIARHSTEAGVQEIVGREIMEYVPDVKKGFRDGDIYASKDDQFRVLEKSELPPGAEWGCEYMTWVVNVHIYCRWLLTTFIRLGGNLVQRNLKDLNDEFDILPTISRLTRTPLVINCSGRNFDTDPLTNAIRGQTVLVRNTYDKTATRHNKDNSWSFLIPRPLGGGTLVGGTKQLGDWGTDIRPRETAEILAVAVKAWPEFVSDVNDFEIVMENVGRRPFREGGLRIERELGQGRTVIHGYGAGPRGYELGWGVAERIVKLVEDVGTPIAQL
ncbi:FAD-dependent oxidoreductase [Aspergillus stella-maris]|uniref:FAD-dependent oxidoreductase n=1 Tax=Aspergillus stella-maris TaxID=1810926 RepID=UPI003CCDD410